MNNVFYSAKKNGFYHTELKDAYEASPEGWPDDAVSISEGVYSAILEGQAQGKVINVSGEGKPVLAAPVIDWQARAESRRQGLLSEAAGTTADWRTELKLGVISDEDKASLIDSFKCMHKNIL